MKADLTPQQRCGGEQRRDTLMLMVGGLLEASRMSEMGVRRDKAALSSGCEPHPATAAAGSNRSSHGGNEVAEAFD
jgi:hypothetical protein